MWRPECQYTRQMEQATYPWYGMWLITEYSHRSIQKRIQYTHIEDLEPWASFYLLLWARGSKWDESWTCICIPTIKYIRRTNRHSISAFIFNCRGKEIKMRLGYAYSRHCLLMLHGHSIILIGRVYVIHSINDNAYEPLHNPLMVQTWLSFRPQSRRTLADSCT